MSNETPEFDPHNPLDVALRLAAIWDDEPDAYLVQRADGDAEHLRLLRNHEIATLDAEVFPENDHIEQQLDESTALLNYYETEVVSKRSARKQAQQEFNSAVAGQAILIYAGEQGKYVSDDELEEATMRVRQAAKVLHQFDQR